MGAVVALDQVTKTWAERALADGPVDLVWTLRFNLTYNSGAAFSLGPGWTPLLTAVGVAILVGLVVVSRSVRGRLASIAMGLMVGGAAGNLCDRIFRDNGGAVIDFVDLQWWPVFNLADASLVVGAIVLILSTRRQ